MSEPLHSAIALISLILFQFLHGIKFCQHIYLHYCHYINCVFFPFFILISTFHFMSVENQGNKVAKGEKPLRTGRTEHATLKDNLFRLFISQMNKRRLRKVKLWRTPEPWSCPARCSWGWGLGPVPCWPLGQTLRCSTVL